LARRNRPTESDRLFEAYLTSRGIPCCFEPPWPEVFGIDVAANPDYLVEPDGVRAVCEVKHFQRRKVWNQLLAEPGKAMPVAPEDDWGPVRFKIDEAARKQLAPFKGLGVPLVVVLANPLFSDVALDWWTVAPAILGNDQQTVLVGSDPPLDQEGVPTAGPNGTFRYEHDDGSVENLHPHVSAVVVVPNEPDHVEVYDLSGNPTPPGFQGTPLPRRLFDGPGDRWYGFDGDSFGQVD
jgi:hypothetical protein